MDKSIKEASFFKVVYDDTTYVFVGNNKKNYEKSKRLKQRGMSVAKEVLITSECIFRDDTVGVVLSKIKQGLEIDGPASKIYAWCKRRVPDKDHQLAIFLDNLFYMRKLISAAELISSYMCVTGKRLSLDKPTYTQEDAEAEAAIVFPSYMLDTLGFKYMDGSATKYFPVNPKQWTADFVLSMSAFSDETCRTLEAYGDIVDDVIYVTSLDKANVLSFQSLYFPKMDEMNRTYNSNAVQQIRDFIPKKTSHSRVFCHPSFIHVRINETLAGENINMFKTFSSMEPTAKVPFIKWISFTKTIFKLHKSYMSTYKSRAMNDLKLWTKVDATRFIKSSNELVVIKIPIHGGNMATVICFSNGMYDIRMNFKAGTHATMPMITTILTHVCDMLSSIFADTEVKLPVPTIKHVWTHISDIRIVKMICGGVIEDNDTLIDIKRLNAAVATVGSDIFAVQGEKGGKLDLLYKRIDQFSRRENIFEHMKKFNELDKASLVEWIKTVFSLDKSSATRYFNDWEVAKKSMKKYYARKSMKSISISLKPTQQGCQFAIDGATSIIEVQRIIQAIQYMMAASRKSDIILNKRQKKYIVENKQKEVVMNKDSDDSNDSNDFGSSHSDGSLRSSNTNAPIYQDNGNDIDIGIDIFDTPPNDDGVDQFFDAGEIDGDDMIDDYNDNPEGIEDIKNRMECPGPPTKGGSVLTKLQEADPELVHKKDVNYSEKCQAVGKRQPVVMTPKEVKYNDKCFPMAIRRSLHYGSTPELAAKNGYTCPKVWCPKSRVALTMEQYEKLGKKCPFPKISEEAVVFEAKDWKGRERHVGFLSPTAHPGNLCMPCCFVKPMTDKNNKCETHIGNEKYIKMETYPLEEKRYGILPRRLTKLFENKYCGNKDGAHGLMNGKTDCYLRYGLSLNTQNMFQCIINSFSNDANTNEELIKIIVDNLTMPIFMSLNDGLVCKAFLPSYNTIDDLDQFYLFREWFLNKAQTSYVERFNLKTSDNLYQTIMTMKYFNSKASDKAKNKQVMREFQLYQSYNAYIKYLADDKIYKKHEFIAPLLYVIPELNPHSYNLIILEDTDDKSYASCPIYKNQHFDKERPTIILLRQGLYYEPIHYARYEKNKIIDDNKRSALRIDTVHFDSPRANKVINMFLNTCLNRPTYFDPDGARIRTALDASTHAVKAQILDFKFHVIGYYTKTNVIVPLKKPMAMDLDHPSTFIFVDTCLKNYDYTIDDRSVKKILKTINNLSTGYYQHVQTLLYKGEKMALKMTDIDLLIPLCPYTQIKDSGKYEPFVKDGAIFVLYEKNDVRKSNVDMNKYIEVLFATYKNELVNLIQHKPELKELMDTLRHPSNPMPWAYKRTILVDVISPFVKNLVFKGAKSTVFEYKPRETLSKNKTLSSLCTNIGIRKADLTDPILSKCANQCTMSMVSGNRSCKLTVPVDYYEYLFERCLEFLLNPISKLHVTKVIVDDKSGRAINENVATFSNIDVNQKGLGVIIEEFTEIGTNSFKDVGMEAVEKEATDEVTHPPSFMTNGLIIKKPTIMASLTDFEIKEIKDNNWIYELFVAVNSRLNTTNLTVDELKKLVLKKIRSDKEAITALAHNPSFEHVSLKIKTKDIAIVLAHPDYHIGDYEIKMASLIVGVNVFMTSRQSLLTPDKMRCLGKHPKKDYYVMINQKYVASEKRFQFELYIKGTKYLLTQADFGPKFSKCVRAKCTSGYVSGDLDGVCPPYK